MSGAIVDPYVSGAYYPYIPPPQVYSLPPEPFNTIIQKFGVRLAWGKSHRCACVGFATYNSPAGSPNPACMTCGGRGIYWDTPLTPFTGLITYGHTVQAQNEPGARMHQVVGEIFQGEPRLTIPFAAGQVWEQASEYDVYVEIDATMRFDTTLYVSGVTFVPYQQNLTIAASGAVTVWSASASAVVPVAGYTVSGAQVLLPSGALYPANTPYIVEFNASPAFVSFRLDGGFPHVRPFVGGSEGYPKRFRLLPLDLWIRDSAPSNFALPSSVLPVPM